MNDEEKQSEDNQNQETKNEDRKKKNLMLILIIVAIILVIAGGVFALLRSKSSETQETEEVMEKTETIEEEVRETIEATQEAEATESAQATQSAIMNNDEKDLIKNAVLESIGLKEEEVAFTITKKTISHAKGNIREIDAVSGGYWLAAKDEKGKWVTVYDGQANPPCEDIELYDFPTDLVPECLDTSGNVTAR